MSRLLFTRITATTTTTTTASTTITTVTAQQPCLRRPRATTSQWHLTSRPLVASHAQSSPCNNFHTSTLTSSQHHHNSNKRNHYERLGLTEDATKKEIKTQFYKLSKLHHPDKTASEASRLEFLSINEAYSILGDERKRRDYDLTFRDKTGALYSNSSSSSSTGRPLRGSLRRTPFRHSAQSAAAAAAARQHGAFRQTFGMGGVSGGSGGGGGGGGGPVPHFDSKSHQEMHYEQEIRQEERRQARERASEDAKWRKTYEESDSATGKIFRVTFVFLSVLVATSFMRAFADEVEDDEQDREEIINGDLATSRRIHYRSSPLLSQLEHVRSHHNDSNRIALNPSLKCDLG